MKIIIAGAGKIGYAAARLLVEEGNDVTIIDNNATVISGFADSLDAICYVGNATNSETLELAGARDADILFAATETDEVNMISCISAKKLGTKHVIARVRDPEYLNQEDFLRNTLELSMTINPEYECAKEIARILRFPGASRIDTFAGSSTEITEMRVRGESALSGMKLKEIPARFGAKVLISVVERGDEAIIPNGEFCLQEGDQLSVTGDSKELKRFFVATGSYKRPVRKAMIMGGSRMAVYLANILEADGISTTIVERDYNHCQELIDQLPMVSIINGDATKSDVLLEEGVSSSDAFIALTGDDGDNIITSMYVSRLGVNKVITKINRTVFAGILENSELDTVVSPNDVVAQQVARFIRAMGASQGESMETLYRLADGKVEALEFIAAEAASYLETPLKQLKMRRGIILGAIIRGRKSIVPNGETVISPQDHMIVIAPCGAVRNISDIFEDD